MIENELSFLVKKLPNLEGVLRKEIEQHYLSESDEPLRLRRAGSTFELTKKMRMDANDPSRQEELTIPLTADDYFLLLPLAKTSLTKTRYYLRLADGHTAELDVFQGPLKGLVMVEVEFASDAARDAFVAPRWFGRDVSQETWSINSMLAGKTFAAVKKNLEPATKKAGSVRSSKKQTPSS